MIAEFEFDSKSKEIKKLTLFWFMIRLFEAR